MCLKIRCGSATPSVAEQDVVCYKVLKKLKYAEYLEAPIRFFKYTLGFEYREAISSFIDDGLVHLGFHSFANKSDAFDFIPRLVKDAPDIEDRLVVCRCTIPKGSRYYVGGVQYSSQDFVLPNGYCSERIRIDSVIET